MRVGRQRTEVVPAGRKTEASPWSDRRFIVFATGNTVNNLGEGVYSVVLPLVVYDRTHSLTLMSLLMAMYPANWLLAPLRGVVADRLGPGRLVMPGLTVQLAAAVALIVIATAEGAPLWLFFSLAALNQLAAGFYQTGWMTGVATMFPRGPARARGTLGSLFLVSQMTGPLLVAVSVGSLGCLGLLWFNAATLLAPMIVWWCGIRPARPAPPSHAPRFLRDLAGGWQVLRATPPVFHLTLIRVPLLFSAGIGSLALFLLKDDWHLSAQQVGTALAVTRTGSVLGTVLVSQRRDPRLRRIVTVTVVGLAASLFSMSLPLLPVFVVAWCLFNACSSGLGTAAQMTVFTHLPTHALGRASGIVAAMNGAPVLAGQLLVPALALTVGTRGVFLVLGGAALLSVAGTLHARKAPRPCP
ncbi:MFS transporter [Streptomyces netropsis]